MQVQLEAWRALLAIPRAFRPIRPVMPDPSKRIAASSAMRPGDTLLVAGAGWSDSSLVGRIEAARAQSGIRVALMLHDIIPLRRPEWFDPGNVLRFRLWLDGMLLLSNRLLAVSASTAADVVSYRRRKGLAACEVSVIRLGDGFSQPGAAPPAVETGVEPPYVLFVSTIEVRKNHALLVDVWRRLLERMPLADVPRLVFAGREGALTGDLMRQLRASDNLDGRVILRHAASDADIAALYRNCAFTIFPSLYEGWGLPVAESLAFGKPCLASNATSMPEVGGRLARYFDPLDVEGATQAVASLLRDPAGLAAWQAEVAREFRPASWSRTAEMVLDALA
jgi:glycosyltransferase involved in cell wall biosynthesis